MVCWKHICLSLAGSLIAFFLIPCTSQAGLLAHWTFDETPGASQVVDSVGGIVGNLSATGSALVSGGRVGGALSLDRATGGYVTMGDVLSLGSGPYSLVVWVKTSDLTGSIALAKHQSGNASGYIIGVNEDNTYGAANKAWLYNLSPGSSPISTTSVNDGQWHQIVGVRGNGVVKIFVDGIPVESSQADQGLNNPPPGTPLVIGGLSAGGAPVPYYTGVIDDVQVYDHALADAEVEWLFDHPGLAVCAPAPAGIISQWKAEGNASDFIGSNNGTLANGTIFGAGMVGGAFSFDGTDDYVTIPDHSSLQPAQYSVGAWVKPSAAETDGALIVYKQGTGAGGYGSYILWIINTGTGNYTYRARATMDGSLFDVDSGVAPSADTWVHLMVTNDGANLRLYVDGALMGTTPVTGTVNYSSAPLLLGNHDISTISSNGFSGLVDEVMIIGSALTADEIAAIYQAGAGGTCGGFVDVPDLRLWLKSDSGLVLSGAESVATWEDRSGNGLDVVQATAGNQPARVSANLNGLPVVRFDGVDDYLLRAAVPGSDLFANNADTVFLVQKQAGTDPRTSTFSWTSDGFNRFMVHATWEDGIYYQASSNAGGGDQFGASQPYGWDDRWHVLKLVKDGGNGLINVDGIDLTLTATSASAGNNSPSADLYVGSDWWTVNNLYSSTNWFTGDIAEILVFSRALTPEEQQAVDTYLRGKYGLTSTPDVFALADKVAQPLNSLIESDPITVAGISMLAPISISSGGEYAVNGGAYTADPGIVVNGDSITVRQTSSGAYGTQTDVTLTIGGVSDTFSVTTLNLFAVTANAGGNGSGTVASDAGGISYSYPAANTGTSSQLEEGSSITVTATAATGSTVSWSGCAATGGTSTAATCTFASLAGNQTVTATFTLIQYTVTANADGTGNGTVASDVGGINYSYPGTATGTSSALNHGSSITVTATAATGSTVSWSGCAATGGTSTAATCTFPSLTGNQTVTATFTLNQYTVTANAAGDGSGTVSSDVGGISYSYPAAGSGTSSARDHGSAIILTATADTGSTASWSGCAATGGTTTAATCTFPSLTGNQTVTATFGLDHNLTITLAGAGQGTVTSSPVGIDCGTDCSEMYNYGTDVTLTPTPEGGSRFVGWTGDMDCEDGAVTMTDDLSCNATFSPAFPWLMYNHLFVGSGK